MPINKYDITRLLKVDCITCNVYEQIGRGEQCDDCPFCKSSKPTPDSPTLVGLSAVSFKGILTPKQLQNWGKHQLFMYLYYPELNWQPPPIPDFDNFGRPVNKATAKWCIHHINGDHTDDRKQNLAWLLRTDHPMHEQLNNAMKSLKKNQCKSLAKKLGITRTK
jgi:hypothetical protein